MTNKTELSQLRSAIDRASQLYYTPGCESPVTDDEYEALMGQLREIAPEDPRLTRVGVPYSAEDLRDKRNHSIPMGSLDNTDDSITGFAAWYDKVLALLNVESADINVSLKMDGNSVALQYDSGILVEAISRGNGEVGESLTANAVKWLGVPTNLPVPFTGTVRGEAILYKAEFEKLKEADPELTNPRNVGSGVLGRSDGTDSDKIRLVAFNLVDPRMKTRSLGIKFKALERMGFSPVRHQVIGGTRDEVVATVEKFFDQIESERDSLPFEIDGIVVMIDDVSLQDSITKDRKDALRPKYGRAVKFVTAKAQTKVTGVTITLGHTGVIIPTVILEPVYVGGVTVSNVLLNNWNAASESPSAAHVAIGDTVEIARQGDVIPKIVRVVEMPTDRQPIEEPKVCPICGAPTTRVLRDKEGAATYCTNKECSGQSIGKLDHYIGDSKKGVGILGVGDGVLNALVTSGLVSTPSDLYRLKLENLVDLSIGENKDGAAIRFGQRRATALLAEIEKSKSLPLTKFLGALGVPLLGRRRVEIVANEQGLITLEDWLNEEKLRSIPGDVMRKTIADGLREARPIIDDLLAVGIIVTPHVSSTLPAFDLNAGGSEVAAPVGPKKIAGSTFCWTGTRELLDETKAAGGIEKSGISAKLDYLVQKDATSSSNKTMKAESLGVKIISIDCLRAVLSGERELP
jgi:DNA ligase (NAD+)